MFSNINSRCFGLGLTGEGLGEGSGGGTKCIRSGNPRRSSSSNGSSQALPRAMYLTLDAPVNSLNDGDRRWVRRQ